MSQNNGKIFSNGIAGLVIISIAGPKNNGRVKNKIDWEIPRIRVMINNFL